MIRVTDKGDLYVHQDANWNVIGLTDLGGSLVERYAYTPYGELTVYEETGYGDRDGDGDVDATDKGTVGTTCTGTVSGACRVLDLDFDGDYDSTDAGKFDSLPQGLARHPGRIATSVHQPFAHQGLLYEPEVGQYQNRARQYDPGKRRFVQRIGIREQLPRRSRIFALLNLYTGARSVRTLWAHPDMLLPNGGPSSSGASGSGGGENCGGALGQGVSNCCDAVGYAKDAAACYNCARSVGATGDVTAVETYATACMGVVWGNPPVIVGETDQVNKTAWCAFNGNVCQFGGCMAHEGTHLNQSPTEDPNQFIDDEIEAYNNGIGAMQGGIGLGKVTLLSICCIPPCNTGATPGGPGAGGPCPFVPSL